MRSLKSKKSIIFSTLIGAVIVSLVIVYVVVPVLGSAMRFLYPPPDYATVQGYERLVSAVQDGEKFGKKGVIVPYAVDGTKHKITGHEEDPACPEDCICLCDRNKFSPTSKEWIPGCKLKILEMNCFSEEISFSPKMENSYGKKNGWIRLYIAKILHAESGGEEIVQVTSKEVEGQIPRTVEECAKFDGYYLWLLNIHNKKLNQKRSSLECTPCDDDFRDLELTNDLCNYYVLTSLRISEEDLSVGREYYSGGSVAPEFSFEVPLNSPHVPLFKQQCELDPCKMAESDTLGGFYDGCRWVEDKDNGKGYCVANLKSTEFPKDEHGNPIYIQ